MSIKYFVYHILNVYGFVLCDEKEYALEKRDVCYDWWYGRECGELFQIAEQDMISINQPKTHNYIKPISKEVARLIEKAIDYSKQRYEDTKYIFVNEEQPQKPYQYTTVQNKIVKMIHDNHLLDDITIAKMLGHRGVTSVKYYRKMSNQQMADET